MQDHKLVAILVTAGTNLFAQQKDTESTTTSTSLNKSQWFLKSVKHEGDAVTQLLAVRLIGKAKASGNTDGQYELPRCSQQPTDL
jgi:hypothetical protein